MNGEVVNDDARFGKLYILDARCEGWRHDGLWPIVMGDRKIFMCFFS